MKTRARIEQAHSPSPASEPISVTTRQRSSEKSRQLNQAHLVTQCAAARAHDDGLPEALTRSIGAMSGVDLSDVKVHTGSSQPARLGAHAYAQGRHIHLAPGQEGHLPHEAWHIVQQRQGRVRPTGQVGGHALNDDPRLEREADTMGQRAMARGREKQAAQRMALDGAPSGTMKPGVALDNALSPRQVAQRQQLSLLQDAAGPLQRQPLWDSEEALPDFLSSLRAAIANVADDVLASIGQSAADCPYIAAWFARYGDQGSAQVARALIRYVPAVASADNAQAAIDLVVERVRQGLLRNVKNGSLEGVPAELPPSLERAARPASESVAQRCNSEPTGPTQQQLQAPSRQAKERFEREGNLESVLAWQEALRKYRDDQGGFHSLPTSGKSYFTGELDIALGAEKRIRQDVERPARKKRALRVRDALAETATDTRLRGTPDEQVIKEYTSPDTGKAESYFNEPLRKLDMTEDQEVGIRGLQTALLRSQVAHEVLWRGTGHLIAGEKLEDVEVGRSYTEPGFLSTSTSKRIAEGFAKGRFLIRIQKYKSGRYIRSLGGDEQGGGEEEVLFPAGTRFRYLGYSAKDKCHDYAED